MATFKIQLDNRISADKKGQYNLVIRVCNKSEVHYMNLAKMTEAQYKKVFESKSTDEEITEFRNKCRGYITKCERLDNEIKPFNYKVFKERFFQKEVVISDTLLVKDLFDKFLETRTDLRLRTVRHYKMTRNVLESYQPGLRVADITVDFLKKFEKYKLDNGCTKTTVDTINRNIRSLLRYYKFQEPLIPESFEIPFGNGKISVTSYFPNKVVLSNEEIKKVADWTDFDSKQQEYARDIWLLLYRCNGMNLADAIRLRWDDIQGDRFIFFTRKKTENTRKNNKKQITVPLTPKLRQLIEKIGDKSSPFILGKLKEGYGESYFENKLLKVRRIVNSNLKDLQSKLSLSATLNIKTAREAYASTLKRAELSKDTIGEMLGHSNSSVTERYLSTLEAEKTFKINDVLF